MQIIIDLPAQDYIDIIETHSVYYTSVTPLLQGILNGVVLPEKHGRLVDAEKLYAQINASLIDLSKVHKEIEEQASYFNDGMLQSLYEIHEAATIVPAAATAKEDNT